MGFQQGLSGLNASSKSLEVIGNNIANANTVGAKVGARRVRRRLCERARRRQQRGRHRRHGRRGRAAVLARQHHDHRQPARRRDQRQRLLRGQQGRHGDLLAQRRVQGRQQRLHRQQPAAAADGLPGGCDRDDHPRHRGPAADADRRHRAGGDDQRSAWS
jgi:Flagellar hook protein FlgE